MNHDSTFSRLNWVQNYETFRKGSCSMNSDITGAIFTSQIHLRFEKLIQTFIKIKIDGTYQRHQGFCREQEYPKLLHKYL